MPVVPIIHGMADALLGDYAKQAIPAAVLPAPEFLADSLEKLFRSEVLNFKAIDVSKTNKHGVKDVEKQISELQIALGITADGVLGKRTLHALNNRCLRCLSGRGAVIGRTVPTTAGALDSPRPHQISYFIDGNWPTIDGADVATLIAGAWDSWLSIANIYCTRVDDPQKANVVITTVSVDDSGNIVADATVGKGRGILFPITMRVDTSEQWTASKFQGVITHEFGHLLGLPHSAVNGQLMAPIFQEGLIVPQSEDKQRIQAIWGKPPEVIQWGATSLLKNLRREGEAPAELQDTSDLLRSYSPFQPAAILGLHPEVAEASGVDFIIHPPSESRFVSAGIDDAELPLIVGRTYRFYVSIGHRRREDALGGGVFHEPDWGTHQQLDLLLIVEGAGLSFRPQSQRVTLDKTMDLAPVYFDLTASIVGPLEAFVSILLAKELTLLGEYWVALEAVETEVEVAP